MELTPQQLCEVEFSEQWRGYSRDQVDDFIERVAAAVSTLQDRLRKMTERAVRAEQRALEGNEADGAARRTLVLAQRTADATVAEAKETAARLIAQAQQDGRAIMSAAEASVDEPVAAAEPTARAQIVDLEVTRSRLQADVASLEAHVNDRRTRIKDLLDELQRRVDEGLEGRIAQWPTFDEARMLSGERPAVDVDDLTEMYVIEAQLAEEPEPYAEPEAEPEPAQDVEEVDLEVALEDDALVLRSDDDGAFDLQPAPPPDEPVAVDPQLDPEPIASGAHQPDAGERREELAVPMPVAALDEFPGNDVDDETFFAQLRGALDDDAPLGPREDVPGMVRWRDEAGTAVAEAPRPYDQAQSEGRRFGLLKRRQRRRG